jgi:hypothetical protein
MLKTKTERLLLLAVAFLAGCEASRLANVAVPPAHAGEPVQQWEYACFEYLAETTSEGEADRITEEQDKFGRAGWELTAAAGVNGRTAWCFKRRLGMAGRAPVSAE